MAKDSPSFTIPVSPEAEHLLDRYLEELRQYLLLRASISMANRIGNDGVEANDMRVALRSPVATTEYLNLLISNIATEWEGIEKVKEQQQIQDDKKRYTNAGLPRDKPNT